MNIGIPDHEAGVLIAERRRSDIFFLVDAQFTGVDGVYDSFSTRDIRKVQFLLNSLLIDLRS